MAGESDGRVGEEELGDDECDGGCELHCELG